MHSEWLPLLPLLLIGGSGLVIFMSGACCASGQTGLFMGIAWLATVACGLTAAIIPVSGGQISNMLVMDDYGRFYIVVVAILTGVALLFSFQYAKERGCGNDEFFGLVLFAALGMMLIVCASHWLLFFLGLELLSLCLYVLIAIRRQNPAAGEAALKYFIMGAVASGFLVFGIAMLYAATGSLDISAAVTGAADSESRTLVLFGLGLILVGLGFKLSLAPFHLWAPDVYQGAPAPVTAFLATGSKIAVFAFFLRLAVYGAPAAGGAFFPVLWAMAALTMVAGNITALVQERFKRLLAYSSIAHMGYLLMALLSVQEDGGRAVMFYSAVYALMDLGAFGIIGLLSGTGTDRDVLEDYSGLGYIYPGRAALLAICLLSLAGLPPTAGFIGKFIIFRAAIKADMIGLTLVGILTAIVSVFFYLKIVVFLYMRPFESTEESVAPWPASSLACLAIAAGILWLGILPSPVLALITCITGTLSLP